MKSDSSFDQWTGVSFFKGLLIVLMGMTLYLLRQPPDRISSSLFQAGDVDTEVVFVEQAASVPSSVKGTVVAAEGMVVSLSYPTMTYDDLVEKIFSSERIVVL